MSLKANRFLKPKIIITGLIASTISFANSFAISNNLETKREVKSEQNHKIIHISSSPYDTNNINLITNNGLLYYTQDNGMNWNKVELCYNGYNYDYEPSIEYEKSGVMHMGLNCGVFKTNLKTQQWAKNDYPFNSREFQNFNITKVLLDPTNPKKSYLYDRHNRLLLNSKDFGATWQNIYTNSEYGNDLALSNVMINKSGTLFGISNQENLYKLYNSEYYKPYWTKANDYITSYWGHGDIQQLNLANATQNFALLTYENPYWDDYNMQPQLKVYLNKGSNTFDNIKPPKNTKSVFNLPKFISSNQSNRNVVLMSMITLKADYTKVPKLFVTQDGGYNWTEANLNFNSTDDFVNFIYNSEYHIGTYFASTDSGKLFKSTNYGKDWTMVFSDIK